MKAYTCRHKLKTIRRHNFDVLYCQYHTKHANFVCKIVFFCNTNANSTAVFTLSFFFWM